MKRRKSGKSYLFQDYQVSHVGAEDSNPELFQYPVKNPVNTGLSIRVHKVIGLGKFEYLEVAVYNTALDGAVELDLQAGESIDFYGKYSVEKGRKLDFKKVSINLPLQIERHLGRPVKATEL